MLHERAYGVGLYTSKQSRIWYCLFFLTDYIQRNFVFNKGCLDNIQIFFNTLKYRISVFHMREHMNLVYTLQNRVEKSIVYFFLQIIFSAILLLTLECLDNIQIFFDLLKLRISVFYMREHTELVQILQNEVEQDIAYFF